MGLLDDDEKVSGVDDSGDSQFGTDDEQAEAEARSEKRKAEQIVNSRRFEQHEGVAAAVAGSGHLGRRDVDRSPQSEPVEPHEGAAAAASSAAVVSAEVPSVVASDPLARFSKLRPPEVDPVRYASFTSKQGLPTQPEQVRDTVNDYVFTVKVMEWGAHRTGHSGPIPGLKARL